VEVTESKGGFGGMGGYGSMAASRFDTFGASSSSYTTPGWQRAQKRQARMDRGRLDDDGFADEGSGYATGERRFGDADDDFDESRARAKSAQGTAGARQGSHSGRGTGTSKGRFAARREPLTIEGELIAKSTGTMSPYSVGDRVFHLKFGNGNVVAIDGNKLTIQFDKAGEKRVVDSFVERA
jgi:DNA helicase-2/ATP-dependent DNA helicase PcrA